MESWPEILLDQIGEIGTGESILCFSSGFKHSTQNSGLSNNWKKIIFHVDIGDDIKVFDRKLCNTLNRVSSHNYVFDYFSFTRYLINLPNIHTSYSTLDKIIIFNPFINKKRSSLLSKARYNYMNLQGEQIVYQDKLVLKLNDILENIGHINAKHIVVYSIEDKPYGFKLASKMKNVSYVYGNSYDEFKKFLNTEYL